MKVLLTGAAGFVGTNLSENLGANHEVVGVDLQTPKEAMREVTYVKGDLLDRTFLDVLFKDFGPFDAILHIAAQARVDPSLVDPIGTYRSNVETTINLLEKAKKQAIDKTDRRFRFIYASSEAVYGNADSYPSKENDNFRPISPYASSKVAGDVLVQQMDGKGVSTVVLRSGMGFGPRSPPIQVVTKMILRCMDGGRLLFPKESLFHRVKHPTRDVNYIMNFVDGVIALLKHPEVSGVFNLGSGREVDMVTLAKQIIKTVGNGEIVMDYDFKYRYGEEGMRTWLDISKAKKAFGYDPKWTLEKGLEETYDWLKRGGREFYSW